MMDSETQSAIESIKAEMQRLKTILEPLIQAQQERKNSQVTLAGGIVVDQMVAKLVAKTTSGPQLSSPLDPITTQIITQQVKFAASFVAPGTSAATAGNYSIFFQADRSLGILSVAEIHVTKGTDASAVSLQLEKLTGTTAPGSGTTLLTTAFDLKGTINTVQYGNITASAGKNSLQKGDRLAAKLTGTPTAVANVVMTVFFQHI